MKHCLPGWRFAIVAVVLFSLAGCGYTSFVYKPGPPLAGAVQLPVKIAVLPFVDATEDFTTRGSGLAPESMTLNLVKFGIPATTSALTPAFWAKSFADDLAASRNFQSVRFVYSQSELLADEIRVEATVEKAYAVGSWNKPFEIVLQFSAAQGVDHKPVWEKSMLKVWTPDIHEGCGIGYQCILDQRYADLNRVMQSLFAEARVDLVRTLSKSAPGVVDGLLPVTGGQTPNPPPPESVEQTIDQILRQK